MVKKIQELQISSLNRVYHSVQGQFHQERMRYSPLGLVPFTDKLGLENLKLSQRRLWRNGTWIRSFVWTILVRKNRTKAFKIFRCSLKISYKTAEKSRVPFSFQPELPETFFKMVKKFRSEVAVGTDIRGRKMSIVGDDFLSCKLRSSTTFRLLPWSS